MTLVTKMTVAIDGGEAGQEVAPIEIAGCYAPGGRYPLPSSVLMGAVTARCVFLCLFSPFLSSLWFRSRSVLALLQCGRR